MKKSLYDQSTAWANLEADGYAYLPRMAREFTLCADMDRALGTANAVSHWHSGRNKPSRPTEMSAKAWLAENIPAFVKHKESLVMPPPEQPKPAAEEAKMLLVIVPPKSASKVARILAMMDCEVEEIQ